MKSFVFEEMQKVFIHHKRLYFQSYKKKLKFSFVILFVNVI